VINLATTWCISCRFCIFDVCVLFHCLHVQQYTSESFFSFVLVVVFLDCSDSERKSRFGASLGHDSLLSRKMHLF